METEMNGKCSCDDSQGCLPNCAPLAAAYVPVQQENSQRYKSEEALARGTLFPGLDLPWKNIANTSAGPRHDSTPSPTSGACPTC